MLGFFNYVDRYGMLNHIPYILLIDWAKHDRIGQSTTLNAIFYGALKVFLKEFAVKVITGSTDVDKEWGTYLNTLKKMGSEDYITLYQKIYDNYKGNLK